ncbi:hypothetical protein BTUL_0217g00200 [Botrytis tulipae]|uniref:Uncharacterized protein n=1 Tax=Botrytis tulipae TaxID=87230 RepID=A0A4Z1E836_9HELO|nr:hypothetical protein BTUL_0217g00200 [Botrytis tulipae]
MSNLTNLSPAYLAEDKSSQLVVTNSVFFGLTAITVLLRFVARKLKSTSWGVDDYLIAIALCRIFSRAIDEVEYSPTISLAKEEEESQNQALISIVRFG